MTVEQLIAELQKLKYKDINIYVEMSPFQLEPIEKIFVECEDEIDPWAVIATRKSYVDRNTKQK